MSTRMRARQKEALAFLLGHGPLFSWQVRRTGFTARTFDALAERGLITRTETVSRYTKLPVVVYRHPQTEETA